MTKKIPDCRTCGACCVCPEDQGVYCDLEPGDVNRLSESFVKKNVLFCSPFDSLAMMIDGRKVMGGAIRTRWRTMRSGPFKSYEINTCVALRGSVMHKVSCSIYKNRPRVCHIAVKPGDRACKDVRRGFLRTIQDLALPEGDGLYRAYLNGVR
jgi:Fe-S-cluster containining protein